MLKWTIIISATVFFAVLGYLLWQLWLNNHAPTIELEKAEWQCTKFREPRNTTVQAGKITILIPQEPCVQYSFIGQ